MTPSQRSGALALVAVVALLASGCGGGGKLSAKALTQKSTSLESLAAEGALLARHAGAGKTTRIFTRVHSGYLHEAASKEASSLRAATSSGTPAVNASPISCTRASEAAVDTGASWDTSAGRGTAVPTVSASSPRSPSSH